jgi:hypothetical protein
MKRRWKRRWRKRERELHDDDAEEEEEKEEEEDNDDDDREEGGGLYNRRKVCTCLQIRRMFFNYSIFDPYTSIFTISHHHHPKHYPTILNPNP